MGFMEVGQLKIQVVKKDIKNIHLTVYPPNGSVRLATPEKVSEETLRLYVVSRLGWIRKQQRRFQKQEREAPREFIQRESHYFFGKRYLLKIVENSSRSGISANGRYLVLESRSVTTIAKRQHDLLKWYRQQLKGQIPSLIANWEKKLGVSVDAWGVRQMKTKWGTCNIAAKRIWINLELVKKPVECLEFVIVHEMVHLLERKHNNRFHTLMDRYLPRWKVIKRQLNALPLGK
jgi:predicted metal-dependent hydrolase